MSPILFIILGLLPQLLFARGLYNRQTVTCQFSVAATSEQTCSSFAAYWGLTYDKFQELNLSVSCPTTLVAGQVYCVLGSVSSVTKSSSMSSTSTPTSTTTSSCITTTTTTSSSPYEPTQPGLASNCNNFYLVSSGDNCVSIESRFGISSQEFESWNPSISSACSNLFLGYYVCVGIPGAITSATPTTTTTTSSPYEPTQPRLASNYDNFYQVQSGENCETIESKFGISSKELDAWNPTINSGCTNLFLGYYICVGVPGAVTTTLTPTPSPTSPSPEMPSIGSNCAKFYLVQSGDSCDSIEAYEGI